MDLDSIINKTYNEFKNYQTEGSQVPKETQQNLTDLFNEGTQALKTSSKNKVHVKQEFLTKLSTFVKVAERQKQASTLVAAATAFLYQLQRIQTHEDESERPGRKVQSADFDKLGG